MRTGPLAHVFADVAPSGPPGWAIGVSIGLFVLVITAPLVVLNVLGDRRAKAMLGRWAEENGIRLESSAQTLGFGRGPYRSRFRWTTVFAVTAKLPTGESRHGYVCIGNTFVWGYAPEVTWDP